MNKLYYDGSSFSHLLPTGQNKNTGHYVAEKLGLELDHYGHNGKGIEKIIRSAMRYSFTNKDALMLIGFGSNQVLEVHTDDPGDFVKFPYKSFTEEHCVIPLQGEDLLRYADLTEWQYCETKALFNIILLHDYLELNDVNFLIHNLGSDYYYDSDFEFGKGVAEQVNARPKILNFYKNSLHSIIKDANLKPWDYEHFGWHGHADTHGHSVYADFLMEHINV